MYLFLTKHGQQYYQRPIMSQTGSRNQLKVAKGAFRGNKTKQSKQNTQTKQARQEKQKNHVVCLFVFKFRLTSESKEIGFKCDRHFKRPEELLQILFQSSIQTQHVSAEHDFPHQAALPPLAY